MDLHTTSIPAVILLNPQDLIEINYKGEKILVDIIDYLSEDELAEMADKYKIKSANRAKVISSIRKRIRSLADSGVEHVNHQDSICYFFTGVICAIVFLVGLVLGLFGIATMISN